MRKRDTISAKQLAKLLLRKDPAQLSAMAAASPQLALQWLDELKSAQRHHRVELAVLTEVIRDLSTALRSEPVHAPVHNVISFSRARQGGRSG